MVEVSVIMPSYNHDKFVMKAIDSVLNQTYKNFEFIISDDGSTDNTHSILSAINDPRVHVHLNKINRGAAVVHSELIKLSKGKMIALINSDDTWCYDKLEKQVSFLINNPQYSACFSNAKFIDEDEVELNSSNFDYYNVFKVKNKSKEEWLRTFFLSGNSICHPSSLIYKSVYDKIGGYDNSLRQLPDYYQWIKMCKHFDFYVSDEKFINFRILNKGNASAPSLTNNMRVLNEHSLIGNKFFDDVSKEMFYKAFSDLIKRPDKQSDLHFEIEKSFIYFTPIHTLSRIYRVIGLQKLYGLLSNDESLEVLRKDYNFDQRSFHELMGERSSFINDDISHVDAEVNVHMMPFKALVKVLVARIKRRLKI